MVIFTSMIESVISVLSEYVYAYHYIRSFNLSQLYFLQIFLFSSFLQIEGHDNDVNTVAFADNTSQILYSAGDDGLCKVFIILL